MLSLSAPRPQAIAESGSVLAIVKGFPQDAAPLRSFSEDPRAGGEATSTQGA